jgi:RNA polymerase sigma factor (sigma-70 family)
LCAENPPDENAWREFIQRFEKNIQFYALRECRNKISSHEKKQLPEIVQDRVSEVYAKLVDKQHKALKNFKGQHENAIFVYLATITRNIVINWVIKEKKTQSRPIISGSLDDDSSNGSFLQDLLGHTDPEVVGDIDLDDLKQKIELILDTYLRGKNRDRNKLIFKLHFYEELTPDEILQALPHDLTLKTVQNIIANLKKIIRDGLTGGIAS